MEAAGEGDEVLFALASCDEEPKLKVKALWGSAPLTDSGSVVLGRGRRLFLPGLSGPSLRLEPVLCRKNWASEASCPNWDKC